MNKQGSLKGTLLNPLFLFLAFSSVARIRYIKQISFTEGDSHERKQHQERRFRTVLQETY